MFARKEFDHENYSLQRLASIHFLHFVQLKQIQGGDLGLREIMSPKNLTKLNIIEKKLEYD